MKRQLNVLDTIKKICLLQSDVKVTFDEALVTCSSVNSAVVSVHSDAETNFVNSLFGNLHNLYKSSNFLCSTTVNLGHKWCLIFKTNFLALAGAQPIWLGLKAARGGWLWADGTEVKYVNWYTTQPDKCCGEDVSCATTNWIFDNGKWFDTSCQALSGVVCKYNPKCKSFYKFSTTPFSLHLQHLPLSHNSFNLSQ